MSKAYAVSIFFSLFFIHVFSEDPQFGTERVVFQIKNPDICGDTEDLGDGAVMQRRKTWTRKEIGDGFMTGCQLDIIPFEWSFPLYNYENTLAKTSYGDIEFGFFPHVAPKTVEHIFKLVRMGCYNTNHFFRVDKGFVAQVADVASGRKAPMNEEQREEAVKTIVGEFSEVKHVRGVLSMGRYSDPNSAGSSFSILLGDAPHLDGQYAIFGRVTRGDEALRKLEEVPTRREGIFVMPIERISILSTYFYDSMEKSCEEEKSMLKRRLSDSAIEQVSQQLHSCQQEMSMLKTRLSESAIEVERQRMKCLP